MTQFELTGIWGILCVLVALIIVFKVAKKALKTVLVLGLIAVFLLGSNIISLNTIAPEIQAKVDAVVEHVGESYISTKGDDVMVKIGDTWYNVSKIAIIGDLSTDSVVVKYDGKDLYVGEPGLINVLRVLKDTGLVQTQ